MKIKKINISNLRNHQTTEIEFSDGLNIFYGLNGSGKTTILEALSISAFSKSFLPTLDSSLIRYDKDTYSINTKAINDYEIPYSISVKYNKKNKKEINSNTGDSLTPKEIIGKIPCIILSPDFKTISFGGPGDRRDFVDKLLSQSSRKYLNELIKYRKALRQRNHQLQQAKSGAHINPELLDTWTEVLIKSGVEIVKKRIDFIYNFTPYFQGIYEYISNGQEDVSLEYLPNGIPRNTNLPELNLEEIEKSLRNFISDIEFDEKRRGTTLFGPQRDDILIKINGASAKESASQGQHKSLLISIKFAEFKYLKNFKNETPIALLDDIFSELDKERSNKVLSLVEANSAQTFITVTEAEFLKPLIPTDMKYKIFELSSGRLTETK
jgi:DNA replication and repair protein RecF